MRRYPELLCLWGSLSRETPRDHPPRYGKEYPTGMHSCYFNIFYIDGNGVLMVMRSGCGSLM